MAFLYPIAISLAADGAVSTSNLVSYIIVFLIIGAIFVVVRLAIGLRREGVAPSAPLPPVQTPVPSAPPVQLVALPSITTETLAAAVAAVHMHLKSKKSTPPTLQARVESYHNVNAWLISERMNPYFREDPHFREKIKP
ncbi:MAG: hypothetical protein GU347_04805 [Desulfurococcales archaeon]|nr:hypothetical protein [Desulfurococcales archaeon]